MTLEDLIYLYFLHRSEPVISEYNKVLEMLKKHGYCVNMLKEICEKTGHNRRRDKERCDDAAGAMFNANIFNTTFNDFEDLYCFVSKYLFESGMKGRLSCYDITKAIGFVLKEPIFPRQYVYIDAGAKQGATYLLPRKIETQCFRIPTSEFTPYLGTMPSLFIEDFLCHFRDYLDKKNVARIRISDVREDMVKLFS